MPRMEKMKQAAEEFNITYSCLRRWILSGEFVYYAKVGNRFLINMERLAEFLDRPASGTDRNR